MKIFERRMRIAKGWLVFSLVFGCFAALSFATDEAVLPRGHVGNTRHFLKDKNYGDFALVTGAYVIFALGGAFFTRYQFRRGSWFNPG